MKKINTLLISSACLLLSTQASSAVFNFTGEIEFHNDVIQTSFTLQNDAVGVRIWTDSYQGGANFDPITALWDENGNKLFENDDNSSVNPATQTIFDSGFSLANLAAGNYIFTIATYNNFSVSSLLSDGFSFDSEQPVGLSDWCQPASSCDMGGDWSLWLDGVDSASVSPIPEPSTYALMLGGLGLVGFMAVRRRAKHKQES